MAMDVLLQVEYEYAAGRSRDTCSQPLAVFLVAQDVIFVVNFAFEVSDLARCAKAGLARGFHVDAGLGEHIGDSAICRYLEQGSRAGDLQHETTGSNSCCIRRKWLGRFEVLEVHGTGGPMAGRLRTGFHEAGGTAVENMGVFARVTQKSRNVEPVCRIPMIEMVVQLSMFPTRIELFLERYAARVPGAVVHFEGDALRL